MTYRFVLIGEKVKGHILALQGSNSLKYSNYYLIFGFYFLKAMKMSILADVANSKRHQRLDKVLIIFTRTVQEISKFVCKKTRSETRAFNNRHILYETRALQHMYGAKAGLR